MISFMQNLNTFSFAYHTPVYGGFKGTYISPTFWGACDLLATYLRLTCDLAATYLLLTCDLLATYLRLTCDLLATYLRLTCDLLATYVRLTDHRTVQYPAKVNFEEAVVTWSTSRCDSSSGEAVFMTRRPGLPLPRGVH